MDLTRNKYDKRDSLEIGSKAEDTFARLAEKMGWTVTQASKYNNMHQHWDFLIEKAKNSFKVDVKAMKRISRQDSDVQDTWFWVELHGVRSYDRGWLYDGHADLIAVEKIDAFILVTRLDLIALVERVIDRGKIVSYPRAAKYKVYSRPGRPDLISMIETAALAPIKWAEWSK